MAANRYVALVSGKLQQAVPATTSTANALIAANASGTLDPSFLPAGVPISTITVPTSANLAAGQFVNLFNSSGVLTGKLSNATSSSTPAHGFVLAATTSPASAIVYLFGQTNNSLTGLTIGADYWLDSSGGGITATAPSSTGNIVQYIGIALSATSILFGNLTTVLIQ